MSENAPSRPPRVYVPDLAEQRAESEENPKKEILLRKEERDHVRSRRLREGDEVIALDGKGARAAARVVRGGATIALLPSKKISSSSYLPGEPANRVIVALACAEPARVVWAIEKGTECGAAGFALLACERSQKAHVAALSSSARLERLHRIAVEATKQCDRTIVPFVEGPRSIEDFLRRVRERGPFRLFVADPAGVAIEDGPEPSRRTRVLSERSEFTREGEGASAGRDRQSPGPGPLLGAEETVIAIGPEGGFTPAEIFLFEEKGALRTSLGARILRLETAVVVALAKLVDPL